MRQLRTLDERERAVVESLAASFVNKLLHQPTVRLKQEAAQGNGAAYAEALQFLFGLDTSAHGARSVGNRHSREPACSEAG